MADFLSRLAHRALGRGDLIQPSTPPIFAPPPISGRAAIDSSEESVGRRESREIAIATPPRRVSDPIARAAGVERPASEDPASEPNRQIGRRPTVDLENDRRERHDEPSISPPARDTLSLQPDSALPQPDDPSPMPRLLPIDEPSESLAVMTGITDRSDAGSRHVAGDRPRAEDRSSLIENQRTDRSLMDWTTDAEPPVNLLLPEFDIAAEGAEEIRSNGGREPATASRSLVAQPEERKHGSPRAETRSSVIRTEPVRAESRASDTAGLSATAPPTIHVTIGRIEVRATTTEKSVRERPRTAEPALSLDAYLRQHNGERS
jgi:hypothetical protein